MAEDIDVTPEDDPSTAEPAAAAAETAQQDEPLLQPCTNCATMLDVSELEPFAKVHCPACGTMIRARTQLKNFTLVEVLGAGGMGAVYKALDMNLERMVALKVVRKEFSADAEYIAKFEREARITASVNHPHVVKVYSFGSDHGLFYIAMELVDKGSLDDLMGLQGRVAEIQALNVGIQIAQGLQAAHQAGLIHRDVKPGNILFADAQTAKIVDFGLALLAEHEAEERGEVWGTPYYVAPEKLDHQPEDLRSDMYSLGGTLFHAIAGRPPFEADTASMVALKHLKSKAVSLQAFAPDVSSATAFVINKTLNKDPEQRYQTYAELIEHLVYARSQLTQGAAAGPRRPRPRVVVESEKKAAGVYAMILVVALVILGAGGYFFRGSIFGERGGASTDAISSNPAVAAQQMRDLFAKARQQIVTGDYLTAEETLNKLDQSEVITQPLQNWVTINKGMVAYLQERDPQATDLFNLVRRRAHFSNSVADTTLVNFFARVANSLTADHPVSVADGNSYSMDSEEALAPFLFALKDWSMGKYSDAGALLNLYIVASPKDPFGWVMDYKPIAQKMADQESAYEKLAADAAGADTAEKRAAALKEAVDLETQIKGRLNQPIKNIEAQLKPQG